MRIKILFNAHSKSPNQKLFNLPTIKMTFLVFLEAHFFGSFLKKKKSSCPFFFFKSAPRKLGN